MYVVNVIRLLLVPSSKHLTKNIYFVKLVHWDMIFPKRKTKTSLNGSNMPGNSIVEKKDNDKG